MGSRNVLVVALDSVADEELRKAIRARQEVEDVTVHIVAPASHIGTLQWLTGAEDEARAEAEELAEHTAHAIEAEVEIEVGDRNPLLAVEDALAEFPADEILVAGKDAGNVEAGLRRFGVPVSRLDGGGAAAAEDVSAPAAIARDVAVGTRTETPFLLLGAVGAFVLAAITLISLIAFIVAWLA